MYPDVHGRIQRRERSRLDMARAREAGEQEGTVEMARHRDLGGDQSFGL